MTILRLTTDVRFEDFEELPVPAEESEVAQAVRRWARFLMAEDEEELELLVSEDSRMEGALETIKTLSQDREAVRLAEDRQASVRLYHHAIALAERKGRAEGKALGLPGAGAVTAAPKSQIATC